MLDWPPPPLDPRIWRYLTDYPPELFSEHFYWSCELVERYAQEWAIELAHRLRLTGVLAAPVTSGEVAARLGFHPGFRPALDWLLERLAVSGLVQGDGLGSSRRYALPASLRSSRLAEVRDTALELDPANAPTLDLFDAAGAAYPAVARGEASGEQALFGMGQIALWCSYFDNRNPTYAVNNRVAAIAAGLRLAERSELRVLEVGAGAGSAAQALLAELAQLEQPQGSSESGESEQPRPLHDLGRPARPTASGVETRVAMYRATEPSPFFRRRAERALRTAFPALSLRCEALDVDLPWEAQGVGAQSCDLVYGVNVLHVARDLVACLGQARQALAPGGLLVAGECLRPFPGQPIAAELVFRLLDGFNQVTTDPQHRLNPGFLTAGEWRRALAAAGFSAIEITPAAEEIRQYYPRFYTGALVARP